jgi:urease alpha subunit
MLTPCSTNPTLPFVLDDIDRKLLIVMMAERAGEVMLPLAHLLVVTEYLR